MSEIVTMTRKDLDYALEEAAFRALRRAEFMKKENQSGRIYRKKMISIVGRSMFEQAARNGWLMVHKHDPKKANSKMWARIEDFENFLKKHTKQKF